MDPLGAVYLKKSGTGSAVTFGKTENKLDNLLKADKTKTATDDIDRDLAKLGGVWEQDIPELTERYKDYKATLTGYEKERDATRRAQLYNDVIRKGMEFETYATKSKTNKQQYFSKSQELAKDKNAFYSDDAQQLLDDWKNKKITDRPDNMGIEMPSNIDPANEFGKLMKMSLGKPQSESVEVIQGGKRVKNTQLYYTDKDIEQAKETSYTRLKPNLLRVEKAKIADQVADKRDQYGLPLYSPKEVQEAQQAWQLAQATDPTAVDKLIKDRLFKYYQPSLASEGVAVRPYIPPRGATGAGGGGAKFQGEAKTTVRKINGADNTVAFYDIGSAQGRNILQNQDWAVPTGMLKDIAKDANPTMYNKIKDIDGTSSPMMSVKGNFIRAERVGDQYYVVVKSKEFADKYNPQGKDIYLPLYENETKISSLTGDDIYAKLDEAYGSGGTPGPSRKPVGKAMKTGGTTEPAAPAKNPKRWEKNKRNK